MNEALTNRIKQYLELDTNYAIIINGDYGIGKTHYIKNYLFTEIKTVDVPNTEEDNGEGEVESEKYIPILISLFGAKSIEDLQNQIFLELYPIFKSKGAKILTGLGKGFLKYIGANPEELLSDSGASSGKLINYSKIVLFIDDIDRKSKDLDLKEFFGFINNLVENLDAKVILIANEDELRKEIGDDGTYYSMLREKVIGISVTFSSNTDTVFDEIVDSKYKDSNKEYYDFLIQNKKVILLRIKQNQQNLRNLIFFLEHFKIIFTELETFLTNDNKFDEVKEELKTNILNFTLPIAIEYKMGKLNSSNYEEIQNKYQGSFFDVTLLLGEKEETVKEETYSDIYEKKYLKDDNFKRIYFDSIFQYILGNEFFDFKKLEKEINSIYNVENNVIPEKEKLFQKLNYWKCLDIKQAEYKKLTSKLLGFVDDGEFPLDQYPSIFRYAVRFDNLMGYNIEKLVKRFKRGIVKGKSKHQYVSSLHLKLTLNKEDEYYDELKEISEYCIEINNNIDKKLKQERTDTLFDLLSNGDLDSFIDKIKDSQEEFRYNPVFADFDFKKFWKALRKLENSEIIDFAFQLGYRYGKNIYEGLFPEKEFLIKLKGELELFIGRKTRTKLEKVAYSFLKDKVDLSLSNFPEGE